MGGGNTVERLVIDEDCFTNDMYLFTDLPPPESSISSDFYLSAGNEWMRRW